MPASCGSRISCSEGRFPIAEFRQVCYCVCRNVVEGAIARSPPFGLDLRPSVVKGTSPVAQPRRATVYRPRPSRTRPHLVGGLRLMARSWPLHIVCRGWHALCSAAGPAVAALTPCTCIAVQSCNATVSISDVNGPLVVERLSLARVAEPVPEGGDVPRASSAANIKATAGVPCCGRFQLTENE